jgi:hypothetical protein
MIEYKNKNTFTKKYRYKLINTKLNKVSEIIFESNPINCAVARRSINEKSFNFHPLDYKPFWFFKILWSLQTWYKRPKKKKIKDIVINSTISKLLRKWTAEIFLMIIAGFIVLVLWDLYKS